MDIFQFLEELGFTSYEKEAIKYLSGVNGTTAIDIYKHSKIPQGRIYSVLQELHSKGIVDIIPTKPKKFIIKDIKNSLKTYLENKEANIQNMKNQVSDITFPTQKDILPKLDSVSILSGRQEHLNAVATIRNEAKKELLQCAPTFQGSPQSAMTLKNALKRNIGIKIIISGITEKNIFMVRSCVENGGEVRISPNLHNLSLLIKDREEFIVGVHDYRIKEERIMIQSRNEALLESLISTFNKLWKKAMPIEKKNIAKK